MPKTLDRLAAAYGISLGYVSEAGIYQRVSERAKRGVLAALGVPAVREEEVAVGVAVAPIPQSGTRTVPPGTCCFMPDWLKKGRAWGITCQLYGLRSQRNCGIGDFEDLARLAEIAGASGADFIGVNPLHALFFADPSRRSPYSPSTRRFLNPLYIAIDAPGRQEKEFAEALASARRADLVDYVAVGKIKQALLAARYAEFELEDLAPRTEQAIRFEAFCQERGKELEQFACYEALQAMLLQEGHGSGWHRWPGAYKSPTSDAVLRFARDNSRRIMFNKWLQWVADRQLGDVQRRARAAGMRIGLYLDLAVGVAPDGADTWAAPDTLISGAHIGSPPDRFNRLGQDWGLSPLSPISLRASGGGVLGAILRDLMRHAGAIRIDHVMGLTRLFWIPAGLTAADGTYVGYPADALLLLLAASSFEHRSLVIGEDLGTVTAGFRDTMRRAEIQGYRVVYFERGKDDEFRPPAAYAREALACISTHDLPPLRGWWKGSDILERMRLGLYDVETARVQRNERVRDRERLLQALRRAGLEPSVSAKAGGLEPPAELSDSVLIGLHAFLARTLSRLVAVQLEDLVGMEEHANLPGTVDEHPNWRRKLIVSLEELPACGSFQRVVHAMATERPRVS